MLSPDTAVDVVTEAKVMTRGRIGGESDNGAGNVVAWDMGLAPIEEGRPC